MSIINNIKKILQGKIPKTIDEIVLMCVDSKYPGTCLGNGFEEIGVYYDDAHIQRADSTWTLVALRYNGTEFEIVDRRQLAVNRPKDKLEQRAHKYLQEGFIQLAYRDGMVVVGIAGDAGAFRFSGDGFGFGTKNAPPRVAHELIEALFGFSNVPNEDICVYLMKHPDCGHYAAGAGRKLEREIDQLEEVYAQRQGTAFINSEYKKIEETHKNEGEKDLNKTLARLGASCVEAIVPKYMRREPEVLRQRRL
ncbi:hypothetical protein JW930_07180 [Candidatus Woesearchaeota archaeon]|nr:hypothetical protein [Candidatus Woesearchaeota archaeon]